jgi:hypothetical protein
MALTDENGSGMVMPVAPMYGNNGGGMGWGNDGWWIILLFLLAGNGMWGGFGGMNGFGGGLGIDFPWLLNGQNGINNNVSDGFRDAQLHDSVTSVRDGINALATQLCGCCGDIQMSMTNGFNSIAQQMYGNEIASLNRSFAEQTANAQGFTGVNSGIADVRYTLASEGCATRANETQNAQAILNALNSGVQSIKDQLCQDKIDAKNDEIAQLRQSLAMKDLAASQLAQNNFIAQGFSNEVDALYNRLNTCPVPTTPVYGRTPIFTCNQNSGCGCGCNGGF